MTQVHAFNDYHHDHDHEPAGDGVPYRGYTLSTELLCGTEWVKIASFQETACALDPERLDRHAEAFGGEVRLRRGGLLLAQWREGQLTHDFREKAAS